MHRPEQAAARTLAYMWYRDNRKDDHRRAWKWAGDHWMEFLHQIDADPTGVMMQEAYHQMNREEHTRNSRNPS